MEKAIKVIKEDGTSMVMIFDSIRPELVNIKYLYHRLAGTIIYQNSYSDITLTLHRIGEKITERLGIEEGADRVEVIAKILNKVSNGEQSIFNESRERLEHLVITTQYKGDKEPENSILLNI